MSITDDALARLRELILSGELQPGSQLPPEQELASQLGVSRSSMREAVRALTHARLVEVRRGLGTFVTGLEPALLLEGVRTAAQAARDESIFEIFEIRRILEPAAAGRAASRITEAQLAELRGHLDAMRQATRNPAEFMHHDEAFHDRIGHAAGALRGSHAGDGNGRRARGQLVFNRTAAARRGSGPPGGGGSLPPLPGRRRRWLATRVSFDFHAAYDALNPADECLDLSQQQITLGRANDATLVLNDDYASSRHARIFPQDGQWIVEDLGSTNGTYLDRQKVTRPMPVPLGVPIRIGKTVLELRR